jgi:hypothetical protein
VTLGYRENLSLTQIKTFLEMESHEERIQEIIERVIAALNSAFDGMLISRRTKNLKRARNARERPSSWKCNAKRLLAMREAWLLELLPTLSILLPHARLCPTHTTAMKRRKRRRLPSASSFFTLTNRSV